MKKKILLSFISLLIIFPLMSLKGFAQDNKYIINGTYGTLTTEYYSDGYNRYSNTVISLNNNYSGRLVLNWTGSTTNNAKNINNWSFIVQGGVLYTISNGKIQIDLNGTNEVILNMVCLGATSSASYSAWAFEFESFTISNPSIVSDYSSAINSIDGKLSTSNTTLNTISNKLTTANAIYADMAGDLSDIKNYGNLIYTVVNGFTSYIDGIEGYIDGVETGITNINTNLNSIKGYVDGVETKLDELKTLQQTTNTYLDTIAGWEDPNEMLQDIIGEFQTANSTINTINTRLNSCLTTLNTISSTLTSMNNTLSNIDNLIDTISWVTFSNNAFIGYSTDGINVQTLNSNVSVPANTSIYLHYTVPEQNTELLYQFILPFSFGGLDMKYNDVSFYTYILYNNNLYETKNNLKYYCFATSRTYFYYNGYTRGASNFVIKITPTSSGYLYTTFLNSLSIKYLMSSDIEYWNLLNIMNQDSLLRQILDKIPASSESAYDSRIYPLLSDGNNNSQTELSALQVRINALQTKETEINNQLGTFETAYLTDIEDFKDAMTSDLTLFDTSLSTTANWLKSEMESIYADLGEMRFILSTPINLALLGSIIGIRKRSDEE